LANIGLDLSEEVGEDVGDDINDDLNNTHQTFDNGLDQTIIIGELEEGNIFDDLKMSSEKREKAITISKEDLKEFVDDLKLKHRAEIDAIMVEQTSYKRIIKQMVQRFKHLTLKCGEQELNIIGLRKYELQCKKFDLIDQQQKRELKVGQA
jgi:hypothetical protein